MIGGTWREQLCEMTDMVKRGGVFGVGVGSEVELRQGLGDAQERVRRYVGRVNATEFCGAAPGTLLLLDAKLLEIAPGRIEFHGFLSYEVDGEHGTDSAWGPIQGEAEFADLP